MSEEGNWLQNLSELGALPKACVDRVCNAIGMVYEPTHIRRIARAEADRKRILAESDADARDIEMRAALRVEAEQVRQQRAIEEVTRQALPHITDSAEPSKVEDDWLTQLFGLVRDVTNDAMRQTWGRILAGEFNRPGTFSRRTLNIVAQMDTRDASLFNTLCCFAIQTGETTQSRVPVVLNLNDPIYTGTGLTLATVSDLQGLGLLQLDNVAPYSLAQLPKRVGVWYQRRMIMLEFKQDTNNTLLIGKVMLTSPGRQLAAVCETLPIDGFDQYLMTQWGRYGISVTFVGAKTSPELPS